MPRRTTPDDGDVQLQIRMPVALHNRLRRKAFRENRSLADVARDGIKEHLKPVKRNVIIREARTP